MKICDITNFYSRKSGGVKTYINHKKGYIRKHNIHQHLLIIPGEADTFTEDGPCSTYTIEGPVAPWEKNYRFIRNLRKIKNIIEKEKPDVIEIGSPYIIPWAVKKVSRKLNIPLIGFFHSNFPETYVRRGTQRFGRLVSSRMEKMAWSYARLVYGWCDIVIAASTHSEESLNASGIINNIKIPFGVDTETFSPANSSGEIRASFGIDKNRLLFLYVGRLTNEKDLDNLIRAFKKIDGLHPDRFALMFVGGGPKTEEIIKLSEEFPNIYCAGYKDISSGLPEYYASSDIFVTPSCNETFGLSPLEAMASAVPAVVVDSGAVNELLPLFAHELALPRNSDSFAEAMLRMAERLTPELKLETREYALNNFSWERTFSSIFEIYTRKIEERKNAI